ncbi:MAG TPA: FkbM family methyltransferase [Castellaniella sp.]|uniref:FkbM family methyltransferase n=1 Tax=Castellaniella sp. TaxID=1955812 RepID=UPI002F17AC95
MGANKGDWSAALLKLKPKFGKLLVCEPQASLRPSLVNLLAPSHDVFIEQVAVGASPGDMVLYADHAGSPLASMYHRDISHYNISMDQQQTVSVTTVDLLLEKYELASVSFLKLDAEGHEFEILKGAQHSLSDCRIRALSFEFGGCNIDSRTYFKDFWQLLVREHGYSMFRILPSRLLLRLKEYSETLEQFNWQTVLACAPGQTPSWRVV